MYYMPIRCVDVLNVTPITRRGNTSLQEKYICQWLTAIYDDFLKLSKAQKEKSDRLYRMPLQRRQLVRSFFATIACCLRSVRGDADRDGPLFVRVTARKLNGDDPIDTIRPDDDETVFLHYDVRKVDAETADGEKVHSLAFTFRMEAEADFPRDEYEPELHEKILRDLRDAILRTFTKAVMPVINGFSGCPPNGITGFELVP